MRSFGRVGLMAAAGAVFLLSFAPRIGDRGMARADHIFGPTVILNGTPNKGLKDMSFYGSYAICPSTAGLLILKMHSGDSSEVVTEIVLGNPLEPLGLNGHFRIAFVGSLAYVPNWDDGLFVVDLSDIESPVIVTQVPTPGRIKGIAIGGSHAYATSIDTGLITFDITDPYDPVVANAHGQAYFPLDLCVASGFAYVAAYHLYTYTLADPSSPELVSVNTEPVQANSVRVQGSLLYVADPFAGGLGGLGIFSLAIPDTPVFLGDVTPAHDYDIDAYPWGTKAFVAGGGGLYRADVSDPSSPTILTDYDPNSYVAPHGLAISRDFAYLIDPLLGIRAYRIVNRGDCNADGSITSSDVIWLVNHVFKSGPAPTPVYLADVDCSSAATASDVIFLLNYVFKGGTPPFCP